MTTDSDRQAKTCTKCGESKPLDQFRRRSDSADGFAHRCRVCVCENNRRWREANLERHRENSRRWKEANPERVREAERQRREENPERTRERFSRWREANPERFRENNRRWREELRTAVFDRYGRVCACCDATENLSIDHVNGDGKEHRAELFGSQNVSTKMYRWLIASGFPPGFQTLCMPCNSSKKSGERCQLDHGQVVFQ